MANPGERVPPIVPPRFACALVVGGAFIAFITFDQSHWWKLKPDYAFGWLVPVLVVFLVMDRWRKLSEFVRPVGPSPLSRGLKAVASAIAGVALSLGLAIFLMGAAYRAAEGPSQPGSFALALGFAGILLGMIYFSVPDGRVGTGIDAAGPRRLRSDARIRTTALFLFPALIWMLSAPLVTAVENAVSLFLLGKVVVVVSFVFNVLGLPVIQQGNVLILPHGQVGVAEACSGIRSLTGCLFAGSFLAAVFMDRLWKKVLLVVAAVAFAFFTNLLRSVFLTAWAYAYGSEAIEGRLHDMTGFAVLGLTSLGLFCLLPLFRASNWHRWLGLAEAKIRV